jgi:hypothetical protein
MWDLGMQNTDDAETDTRGRLDVTITNPIVDAGAGYTDLALKIVQFVDKTIYTGDLTFSLAGGTNSGRKTLETLTGLGGSWVQDEYRWRLDSSLAQISLSITGAVAGTIVDSIQAEATSVVPEIEPILITSVENKDGLLAVSWKGGRPPYEVQISPSLESNENWQRVNEPILGTNLEFEVLGSVGFIKVHGSE